MMVLGFTVWTMTCPLVSWLLGVGMKPDVAPQPPTQLVAEGVSAELIQLRWAPSDRAELYRVHIRRTRETLSQHHELFPDGAPR